MNARVQEMPLLHELLLVDGSDRTRGILSAAMAKRGYSVTACGSAQAALDAVAASPPKFIVTELRLPDDCGLRLVSLLKQSLPEATVVVLTAYASIATAVEAIKRGAANYLIKPASADHIVAALWQQNSDSRPFVHTKALSIQRLEWEYINWVLMEHAGNLSAAARSLSMHRRTLQRKLQKQPRRH